MSIVESHATAAAVDETADLDVEYRKRLRQLAHDLRTPLSIICMGVEALKRMRHDDEQFTMVHEMIVREGTTPIMNFLSALGDSPKQS